MTRTLLFSLLAVALNTVTAGLAAAQGEGSLVAPGAAAAEIAVGYTGFGDDGLIHHSAAAGTLRSHLTPRVSVGAELSYHIGPRRDRDTLLMGLAIFDIRRPRAGRAGRVEPYFVVGGGLMHHGSAYGSGSSWTAMGGGGTRVWVGKRAYVTAEGRMGWPPNIRILTAVGVLFRPRTRV